MEVPRLIIPSQNPDLTSSEDSTEVSTFIVPKDNEGIRVREFDTDAEEKAFQNTFTTNKYLDDNNDYQDVNTLEDANWYERISNYSDGKLVTKKNKEDIYQPFIPIVDSNTGEYILKQLKGDPKSIEEAHHAIVSAYGPRTNNTNFLDNFVNNLANTLTTKQGLKNPLGIKSAVLNFAEATTDLSEATGNYIQGKGFKSEEDSTDKLNSEQRTKDIIFNTPEYRQKDITSSEGLAQALGQGGGSILQFGALGKSLNSAAKGLGLSLAEVSLTNKGVETAIKAGVTPEALGSYLQSGKSLGKLSNAYLKSGNILRNMPQFGAGAIINMGEGYQAAKDAKLNEEDAAILGLTTGIINSAIEVGFGSNTLTNFLTGTRDNLKLIPQTILRETGGKLTKESLDKATPAIISKVTSKINDWISTPAVTRLGQGIKSGVEEGSEEFMQNAVNKTSEILYDNMFAPENAQEMNGKFGTKLDKQTFKEAFSDAAVGFILGAIGGIASYTPSSKDLKEKALPEIRKGNVDILKQAVDLGFTEGKYDEQQKQFIFDNIDEIQKQWDTNKDAYPLEILEDYDKRNGTTKLQEAHEALFDELAAKSKLDFLKDKEIPIIDPNASTANQNKQKQDLAFYNIELTKAQDTYDKAVNKSSNYIITDEGIKALRDTNNESTKTEFQKFLDENKKIIISNDPELLDSKVSELSFKIANGDITDIEKEQAIKYQTNLIKRANAIKLNEEQFDAENFLKESTNTIEGIPFKDLDKSLGEIQKRLLENAPDELVSNHINDQLKETIEKRKSNYEHPEFKGRTFFQKPFDRSGITYERINSNLILKHNPETGEVLPIHKGDEEFIPENEIINKVETKNRYYITGRYNTNEGEQDVVNNKNVLLFGTNGKIIINTPKEIGKGYTTLNQKLDINPEKIKKEIKFKLTKAYSRSNNYIKDQFEKELGISILTNWKYANEAGLLNLSQSQRNNIGTKPIYVKMRNLGTELLATYEGVEISFQNPIARINIDGSVTPVNFTNLTIENIEQAYEGNYSKELDYEEVLDRGIQYENIIQRIQELYGLDKEISSKDLDNKIDILFIEQFNKTESRFKPSEFKDLYKVEGKIPVWRNGEIINKSDFTTLPTIPLNAERLTNNIQFTIFVKDHNGIYKSVEIDSIEPLKQENKKNDEKHLAFTFTSETIDEVFYTNVDTNNPFIPTGFYLNLNENQITEEISERVIEESKVPNLDEEESKWLKEQEENKKNKKDDIAFSYTNIFYKKWEDILLKEKLAKILYSDGIPYYKPRFLNKKHAIDLVNKLQEKYKIEFDYIKDPSRYENGNEYYYIRPFRQNFSKTLIDSKKDLNENITNKSLHNEVKERLFKNRIEITAKRTLSLMSRDFKLSLLAKKLLITLDNDVNIKLVSREDYKNLNLPGSVDSNLVSGLFNPNTNEIYLIEDSFTPATILHEIIHAITWNTIHSDDKAKEKLESLYNHTLSEFKSKGLDPNNYYALTNLDEFLVGVFLNKQLIDKLHEFKSITNPRVTLWDDVKSLLKNLLGLNTNVQRTLFDDVFEESVSLINNSNQQLSDEESSLPLYSLIPSEIDSNGKQTYLTVDESNRFINTITAKVTLLYNQETNDKGLLDLITEEINNYSNRFRLVNYPNINDIQKEKFKRYFISFNNEDNKKQIIKDVYNKLASFYSISKFEETEEEDKNEFGDRYDLSYENIGGVNSLSKFCKAYLQQIIVSKPDEFDQSRTEEVAIDTNNIYNILERNLAYSFSKKDFISKINYLSKYNDNVNNFYKKFKDDVGLVEGEPTKNFNIFNTLFTNFAKYKIDYLFLNQKPDTQEYSLVNKNKQDSVREVYSSLYQGFTNYLSRQSTLINLDKRLKNIQQIYQLKDEKNIHKNSEIVKKYFNEIGLNFPLNYINLSLLKDMKGSLILQENKDIVDTYGELPTITEKFINNFVKSTERSRSIGNKDLANIFEESFNIDNKDVSNEYSQNSLLREISDAYTLFDDSYTSSSFRNAEGNSVFNYQFGSFNITKTYELQQFFKKATESLRKAFNSVKDNSFYENNKKLLEENIYLKNPELLINIKVDRIDGFQDKTFGDFEEKDLIKMQLILSNTIQEKTIDGKKIKYNYNYIKVLEASNTADIIQLPTKDYINEKGIKSNFLDDTYNYFLQQYNRKLEITKQIKQIEEGIFKGDLIKDYNTGKLRGLQIHLGLSEEIESQLQDLTNNNESKVKELIKSGFNQELEEYHKSLEINNLENIYPIDQVFNNFLNNYIQTIYMYQLHHGDLAKSFKDDIDLVKRFKGSNGTHKPYSIEGGHSTLVVKDPKVYINTKTLESSFEKPQDMTDFVEQDLSDAQTWGSLDYELFTLDGLGELNERAITLLDKIQKGEFNNPEEFWGTNGLNEIGVVLNPKKDIVVSEEDYQKTSRFTLTKQLTSYKDENGKWQPKYEYSNLHRLREFMENNNIAKIQPESASKMVKVNVGDINNLNVVNSHITLNKWSGRQVENPSGKDKIIDPTQLIYVITGEHSSPEALKIVETYNKINSLIRENKFNEIYKTITDVDGKIDLDNFVAGSVESLINSGADQQTITFFENYNKNLPNVSSKFEQLFFAYFKEAFSIKVKGNKSTFVSSYGFNIIRDGNGNIIDTEQIYSNPKLVKELDNKIEQGIWTIDTLQFNKLDKNGNRYSEILIPRNDPRLEGKSIGDFINSDILTGIGTRIPHQDKHSMGTFKVVGFLPTYYGSTVVVPPQVHYLAGSDFDVDSWFMEFYEFNDQFKKTDSLENQLLDKKIELYNSTSNEIKYTPATQDSIKEVTKDFPKESFGNIFSAIGKLKAFVANATGKRNIGIVANANITYQFLSNNKVSLHPVYKKDKVVFDGVIEINGVKYTGFDNRVDPTGKRIQDNISTFISAMTDNAKDRQAALANLTLKTLPIATTMLMLGVDVRSTINIMKNLDIEENKEVYNKVAFLSNYLININPILQLVKSLKPTVEDNLKVVTSLDRLGILVNPDFTYSLNGNTNTPVRVALDLINAPMIGTNITNFLKVMNISKQAFIKTSILNDEINRLSFINKTTPIEDSKIISYLTATEYKKISGKEPNENLLFNDSDESLYKQYKDVLTKFPNNYLLRFISFNKTYLDKGINEIKFNTWIKISTDTQNKLQDSYKELLNNEDSKKFAVDLVNYMYTKDSFAFRNNTLLKVIDPIMFKRVSQGLDNITNNLDNLNYISNLASEVYNNITAFDSINYSKYFIPYAFNIEKFKQVNTKFNKFNTNIEKDIVDELYPAKQYEEEVLQEVNHSIVREDIGSESLPEYEYNSTIINSEDITLSDDTFSINNLEGFFFQVMNDKLYVNGELLVDNITDSLETMRFLLAGKTVSQIEEFLFEKGINKQVTFRDLC